MSARSFTKIWLHLIWGTKNREHILSNRYLRKKNSDYLLTYSKEKGIYMKVNYVNSDHVHILIDLPTNMTIEDATRLLKGGTSYWINHNSNDKFNWATGYAAFSVSESNLNKLVKYIVTQEEHHKIKSYTEEYDDFLRLHNVKRK